MERLERPAVGDEPDRQPVEQLGVRGQLAELAEVVDRADEPLAEMPAPDAVDDHPRGERVSRARSASGPARAGRCAFGLSGGWSTPARIVGNRRGTTGPRVR